MYSGTDAPYVDVQFVKSGTWTTVTSTDLREISIRRGRQRRDFRFDAGIATIVLDNAAGLYDPDITTGTWVVAGKSILVAGLQARIVATYGATSYVLFAGILESNIVNQGFDVTATLTITDGLAQLGKAFIKPLSATQYQNYYVGEKTGERAARILDLVGWPSADRAIGGVAEMQGTEQNAYAIDLLNECANVEVGDFFISRDGKATLRVLNDKFSVPTRLEFSDVRPQPTNTIEYESITTEPGTLQLTNQAVVRWSGSVEYRATVTASAAAYGVSSLNLTTPTYGKVRAKRTARLLAKMNADPSTRLTSVSFNALALGALYPDFLQCELLDQVTVHRTTVDGRALTWTVVIEGMDHDITPGNWSTTFYTSPMNPYTLAS